MPCRFVVIASVLGIAACANPPPIQAIDVDAITAVQNNVSEQIGVYIAASRGDPKIKVAQRDETTGKITLVPAPIKLLRAPDDDPEHIFACGSGNLNFEISTAELELVTTADNSVGVDGGATVPIQMVTLDGSAGTTTTASNTQSAKYQIWPLAAAEQTNLAGVNPTPDEIKASPIAAVLTSLREALIGSSTRYDYTQIPPKRRAPKPCFTDYDPKKILDAPNDSYTLGLAVSHDTKVGLTVKVTVLSLGASGEWKSSSGNTLKVSFVQPGLEEWIKQKTAIEKACRVKPKSKECRAVPEGAGGLGEFQVRRPIDVPLR